MDNNKRIAAEQMMIFEMIDASIELAAKKGKHSLTNGCLCIDCVKKRKDIIYGNKKNWKYHL